jgi:hypothetical protein
MADDLSHPIEEVYGAIGAAFQRSEQAGHPVREIDLLAELRANPALIQLACEVKDARAVLKAKRVSRLWKWATLALIALLIGAVFVYTSPAIGGETFIVQNSPSTPYYIERQRVRNSERRRDRPILTGTLTYPSTFWADHRFACARPGTCLIYSTPHPSLPDQHPHVRGFAAWVLRSGARPDATGLNYRLCTPNLHRYVRPC